MFAKRSLAVVTWLILASATPASDHLDSPSVTREATADIGDFYAWMSSDTRRLNLAMTLVGASFSERVDYVFHLDSGPTADSTRSSLELRCGFAKSGTIDCRAGEIDRATGDASHMPGLRGAHDRFRVFADLRDDPFFNNVRGSRAALDVAAKALRAGIARDAGGCPRFDAATTRKIVDEWRHTAGKAGSNFLAGWKTAAIIVEIDVTAVNGGGPVLALWATTELRETGTTLDRMGRGSPPMGC